MKTINNNGNVVTKYISKHWKYGGKELDAYDKGDNYNRLYTVTNKEATRTRKSMWITLELTLTSTLEGDSGQPLVSHV